MSRSVMYHGEGASAAITASIGATASTIHRASGVGCLRSIRFGSHPSSAPVSEDGEVLLEDAAYLLQRRTARVLVELALRHRRRDDGHVRRLLAPDQQRAAHVVRRANEQHATPPV